MKDVTILTSGGVNVQKSLELLGDMTMYDETLQDFLNSSTQKLTQIKQYKEIGDMNNYAILVHSLKSDSKYLGFETLADLSYNHEMESKSNNLYYVSDHYDELIAEANRIINLVKKYLGQNYTQPAPTVSTNVVKDKTILVVDDSTIISNYIHKIFQNQFNVLLAHDGKEAMDIVSNNIDKKIVTMLLDLNMPNVNGFAVLEYFKQNNLFRKIPVAIITGDDSKDIINKAFTYDIIDVVSKPFNEANIKQVIEKATRIYQ